MSDRGFSLCLIVIQTWGNREQTHWIELVFEMKTQDGGTCTALCQLLIREKGFKRNMNLPLCNALNR